MEKTNATDELGLCTIACLMENIHAHMDLPTSVNTSSNKRSQSPQPAQVI